MKPVIISFLILTINLFKTSAYPEKIDVYLIPGMGIDSRVYSHFSLDTNKFNAIYVNWEDYKNVSSMEKYAQQLSNKIDTSHEFIIVGISMGGMVAIEMQEYIEPEAIFLIASAKCSKEVANRYKIGSVLPLYELINERNYRFFTMQKWIYKPIKNDKDKELYEDMVMSTGPELLKWQSRMIVNWERECIESNVPVFHIHGSKDNILPIRKVEPNAIIEGGTHKMAINYGNEISKMIESFTLANL